MFSLLYMNINLQKFNLIFVKLAYHFKKYLYTYTP